MFWIGAAPTAPGGLGVDGHSLGQGDGFAQFLVRRRQVRDRHRLDEELLEPGFDRGLDLFDPPYQILDLAA